MYQSFAKLHDEKKTLILDISLAEFVENGYDNASTDVITSKAGISKGSLFHYFKSKKNLYLFLFDHCIKLLTEITVNELAKIETKDFFERIKCVVLIKQEVAYHYYQESKFTINAMANPPQSLRQELEMKLSVHKTLNIEAGTLDYVFMKSLISPDQLRDGISIDKAVQFTISLLEQLNLKYLNLFKSRPNELFEVLEPLNKELDECIDFIKYGVYRV